MLKLRRNWKKFVCRVYGHISKIHMKEFRCKAFSSGGYRKQRNKSFSVVFADCICERCGKLLDSNFYTD
jgi:hypothetical protein